VGNTAVSPAQCQWISALNGEVFGSDAAEEAALGMAQMLLQRPQDVPACVESLLGLCLKQLQCNSGAMCIVSPISHLALQAHHLPAYSCRKRMAGSQPDGLFIHTSEAHHYCGIPPSASVVRPSLTLEDWPRAAWPRLPLTLACGGDSLSGARVPAPVAMATRYPLRRIARRGLVSPSQPLLQKYRDNAQDGHHDGLDVECFHIGTHVCERPVCG
jgi:hypothetical protein